MARQERAVRTRNALIESAAELFDRDGFEVASLTTISARAGVSNGALHFHFSNKAALADAVWEAAAQRLRRITARRTAHPLQCLIDATHALCRGLGNDAVLRAGFELCHAQQKTRGDETLRESWQRWVEDVLAQADAEGALVPDVTARDAAATVVAATMGFETLSGQDNRWLSHHTVTRFWTLLLPRLAEESIRETLVVGGSQPTGADEHRYPGSTKD
ncbi:ScbR family autoregulator-binding transcription factor [Streptomyces sp. CA-250714]|uniref:ScbR family autoregulator-binding transcription factor n=1 Tax=Streptomyces sp. CA-250714 TaxID=3240060 RepID=UPI003D8C2F2F